jgi:hypothetical protein
MAFFHHVTLQKIKSDVNVYAFICKNISSLIVLPTPLCDTVPLWIMGPLRIYEGQGSLTKFIQTHADKGLHIISDISETNPSK